MVKYAHYPKKSDISHLNEILKIGLVTIGLFRITRSWPVLLQIPQNNEQDVVETE